MTLRFDVNISKENSSLVITKCGTTLKPQAFVQLNFNRQENRSLDSNSSGLIGFTPFTKTLLKQNKP